MLFIHLRTYRSWMFHSGIEIAEYFDEPWPWFWLDLNHGQRVLARISLAAYPVSGPIEIIRTTVSGTRRDNCSFSDRLPPTDDFPPLCSRNWKSAFVSVWDIYIYICFETTKAIGKSRKGKRSLWNFLEEWRIQLLEACICLIRSWRMVSDD